MELGEEEVFYQIALSFVQGIGPKMANNLIATFGSAKAVITAPAKELISLDNMGSIRVKAIKDSSVLKEAEKELQYVQTKNIEVLSQVHLNFPKRLLECSDAPQLLYYKGKANLNAIKTVAIIGTRKNTEYGHRLTNDLIEGLSKLKEVVIVSGLAHGIDTIAHKASIKNNIPTVGVLGHGLQSIYPVANKNMATEMQEKGGLLTEFPYKSKIDKGNFPARNRIVAGISDLTVVVESDIRGGALITAFIANSYNREVAAFPGRAYDNKSAGTNMLVRKNIASLITNADDLLALMNWTEQKKQKTIQTQLLLNLSAEEQTLIDILQKKDTTHADELLLLSGQGSSALASNLLLLEMQGLIKALPGKLYRMN